MPISVEALPSLSTRFKTPQASRQKNVMDTFGNDWLEVVVDNQLRNTTVVVGNMGLLPRDCRGANDSERALVSQLNGVVSKKTRNKIFHVLHGS